MAVEDVSDLLHFNGIDGVSGGYGLSPMSGEALAELILVEPSADNAADLRARHQRDEASPERLASLERELEARGVELARLGSGASPDVARMGALERSVRELKQSLARRRTMGVKEGVDATDLSQAGWGAVFPVGSDPAIREALEPLLALRAAQAGARHRIYEGPKGLRPGELKSKFLQRHGAASSGPVDPEVMPYYLLLVGSPDEIPFSFQYQLDVQYAVGRIHFPTVEQYAHYAQTVVEAETTGIRRPRRMSMFGVNNPDDVATQRSASMLVEPLSQQLGDVEHWEVETLVGERASRRTLEGLLGGEDAPAVLFTASHGVEFPSGDPRQRPHQGALLCGDWPGPERWTGSIPERFYFAGEHLGSTADVAGMMVFCFACYTAGTPQHDQFARLRSGAPRTLAPAPFVSALPMSLLGRPQGALAVIGHVDRAWGCSFMGQGPGAGSHTATFESAMRRLMGGQPVGHALDYFNARYAELSTELSEELQDEFKQHDPHRLVSLWTSNNDARGYVVLGDPAARLSFDGGAPPPEVPTSNLIPSPRQGPSPDVLARPSRISAEDWERTPMAVRRFIAELLSES